MEKLERINQKLESLLAEKERLERKSADALYRDIAHVMGDAFCVTLATQIVKDAWEKRTPHLQERWQAASKNFLGSKPSHAKTPSPESKNPDPGASKATLAGA